MVNFSDEEQRVLLLALLLLLGVTAAQLFSHSGQKRPRLVERQAAAVSPASRARTGGDACPTASAWRPGSLPDAGGHG